MTHACIEAGLLLLIPARNFWTTESAAISSSREVGGDDISEFSKDRGDKEFLNWIEKWGGVYIYSEGGATAAALMEGGSEKVERYEVSTCSIFDSRVRDA
jgi:hypothetical protein